MKAYEVTNCKNDDLGTEIIFAENSRQARNQAWHSTQIGRESDNYTDLKVKRFPPADGYENKPRIELMTFLWHDHGWRFFDYPDMPDIERGATEEEFRAWFEHTFQ